MVSRCWVFGLIFLMGILQVNATENNIYVNDSMTNLDIYTLAPGSDNGNGTIAAPYASLQMALAQATDGATIYVDTGVYQINETIYIIDFANLTIYGSDKGEGAILQQATGGAPRFEMMKIEDVSNLVLKVLRLQGGQIGIHLELGVNVVLDAVQVEDVLQTAFVVHNSQSVIVRNWVSWRGNYVFDFQDSDVIVVNSRGYQHFAATPEGRDSYVEGLIINDTPVAYATMLPTAPASAERQRYLELEEPHDFIVDVPSGDYRVCIIVGSPSQYRKLSVTVGEEVLYTHSGSPAANKVNRQCRLLRIVSQIVVSITAEEWPIYIAQLSVDSLDSEFLRRFTFGPIDCTDCRPNGIAEAGRMYDPAIGYGWDADLSDAVRRDTTTWARRAFPSIVKLADSNLLLAFYAGDGHESIDGEIHLYRSSDGGYQWNALPVKIIDEECDNRNPSLSVTYTGRVVLLYNCVTWDLEAQRNQQYLLWRISDNDGLTWSDPRSLESFFDPEVLNISEPRDSGIVLADTTLIISIGADEVPFEGCAIIQTTDNAETFSLRSTLGQVDRSNMNIRSMECSIALLGNRFVATSRRWPPYYSWLMYGDQSASEWSDVLRLPISGSPHDLVTIDDMLVMVTAERQKQPQVGSILLYTAYEGGYIWDIENPFIVRNDLVSAGRDYGYPSAILNKDGDLVIAYYGSFEGEYSFIAVSILPADYFRN